MGGVGGGGGTGNAVMGRGAGGTGNAAGKWQERSDNKAGWEGRVAAGERSCREGRGQGGHLPPIYFPCFSSGRWTHSSEISSN